MASERYQTIPNELVNELNIQLSPSLIHYSEELPESAQTVISELEQLSQAYLFLEPLSWMGVVTQPSYEELHPETPHAVRIAIEKIGSLYLYWNAYADEMKSYRLGIAPDTHRNVLEIASDKTVRIIQDRNKTKKLAEGRERISNDQYEGYVVKSNWIGDADFWGASKPSIFPMRVKIAGSTYDDSAQWTMVSRKKLNISGKLEKRTWNRWRDVFTQLGNLHTQAVTELCNRQVFAPVIQQEIAKGLNGGVDLSRPFKIERLFLNNYLDDKLLDILLDDTHALVTGYMINTLKEGKTASTIISASDLLASKLNEMWHIARSSNSRE